MNKTLLYAIGLAVLAVAASGCDRCDDPTDPECPNYCVDETNPECPNYDACWDQGEVSAEFHMYERRSGLMPDDWVDYDTDTLCGWGIEFKALLENAEYEWYLGSEVIRTRSFVRSGFPRGIPLTVTLIVRKKPSLDCFPADDGIDTLTRIFVNYGSNRYCGSKGDSVITTPIRGRYEGVFASEPGVVRQIEVMPCGMYIIPVPNRPDTVFRPGIFGLPPMDSCTQWSIDPDQDTFFGYRQWYYSDDGIFYNPSELERCKTRAIFIRVFQPVGTDSVTINYTSNDQGVVKKYQFQGKKTN